MYLSEIYETSIRAQFQECKELNISLGVQLNY